jgi:hypothetical protein
LPGISEDGVTGLEADLLVAVVGHARQRRHRLALRTGRHQHHLVRRSSVDLVDDDTVRHVQVAEIAGDLHVADHRAADVRDLATVLGGGVDDLLHAVDVRRERRDDDASAAVLEHRVDRRRDVALGRREAGHLGIRRVGEEQVDTLLAETGEGAQVGDAAVERQLIHLEVAGVQRDARRSLDRHGEGVGDRVVDRDELELERTEVHDVALGHRVLGRVLELVLLELRLEEGQRQLGADDRDVAALAQQVRDTADVVLVAVRQDDADDVLQTVTDRTEVGEDQIDTGLGLLGEEDAAVDDEDLAAVLERRHVASDLAESSQRDDAQGAFGQCGRSRELQVHVAHVA